MYVEFDFCAVNIRTKNGDGSCEVAMEMARLAKKKTSVDQPQFIIDFICDAKRLFTGLDRQLRETGDPPVMSRQTCVFLMPYDYSLLWEIERSLIPANQQ